MTPATIGAVIVAILLLITILSSLRICNEWERKVVLRLGRFGGVRGPGIFFLLPYIETTPFTIDTRVTTTPFMAEQTLTKDGASVTVDAIMYWRIVDAGRRSRWSTSPRRSWAPPKAACATSSAATTCRRCSRSGASSTSS
jgi:regulator of protease activity HflC (stomatin/prohibitin superfamily)